MLSRNTMCLCILLFSINDMQQQQLKCLIRCLLRDSVHFAHMWSSLFINQLKHWVLTSVCQQIKSENRKRFFFFGWFLLEWVDLNDELTTRLYYTRKTINKMHLNFTCSLCLYTFCLSCVVEHWSESWSLLHLLALTSSDKY